MRHYNRECQNFAHSLGYRESKHYISWSDVEYSGAVYRGKQAKLQLFQVSER